MKLIKLGIKLQKKLKILSSSQFPNTGPNIQKDFDELDFDTFLSSSKHRSTGLKQEEVQY
jgi:hypothetical protein